MINQFSLGLTALRAAQIGLATTGQNIANANTPGYHRQTAQLVNRPSIMFGQLEFGTGVDVNYIRRAQSEIIEQALTENISAREGTNVQLDLARQVETIFAPGPGSLNDRIDVLFNKMQELSSQPHDRSARKFFVDAAVRLTDSLHSATSYLDHITQEVDQQLKAVVKNVNGMIKQVVDLNNQIRKAKAMGVEPNNLLDRRDAVVNELAKFIDVEIDQNDNTVLLANGAVLAGRSEPRELEVQSDADGVFLVQTGQTRRLNVRSGQIAGLLAVRNEIIPSVHQRLDDTARGLVTVLDSQHAQGLGIDGLFQQLTSQRPVSDAQAPLAELETIVPITSGQLFVGIIDSATGRRTLHSIAIDPEVDTLETLATKLSSLSGMQAVVNLQTGQLSMTASSGYAFDFTGRPETAPDASALTGSATPRVDGVFSSGDNGELQFVFSGSGEIGVTPGLQVLVQDQQGNTLEALDIGEGYSPNSAISLSDGALLHMSPGTVVDGESFTTLKVTQSDTAGVLTALGLNTFFQGNSARTLEVRSALRDDPDRLATSISGESGDGENLSRMIARRDLPVSPDGSSTLEQLYHQFVADIGQQVQEFSIATESLDLLGESLAAQQASYSGVDPNEEAVHMLEFQRSFEAAARYLAAVDQTTQELLSLLG